MAEPVGTTLGALGVVGILSVCLDCFNFIQDGRSIGKDFTLLQTDFASQHFRFHVWARTSGFVGGGDYDHRLDSPEVKVQVRKQLEAIALLFMNARKVVQRYQIVQNANQPATSGENVNFVEEGLHDFLQRIKRTKRQAGFLGAVRWAIKDKTAFETLLQRLRSCIDALYFVTETLDLFKQESLQQAVEIEIESIDDVDILRCIVSSSASEPSMPNKLISDTASHRIASIGGRHTSDDDSNSGLQTFATVPEEQSVQQSLEHFQMNPAIVAEETPVDGDNMLVMKVLESLISEYRKHSSVWLTQELSFDRFIRTSNHQAERNKIISSAGHRYDEVMRENPPWVLERLRQLTAIVEETIVSWKVSKDAHRFDLAVIQDADQGKVEFAHDRLFKIDPVLAGDPAAVQNVTVFQLILPKLPQPNTNLDGSKGARYSSNGSPVRAKREELDTIGYFWAFVNCLQLARNSQRVPAQRVLLSDNNWGAQLVSIRQMDELANGWTHAMIGSIRSLRDLMNNINRSEENFMSTRVVKAGRDSVEAIVTFEGPLQSPYSGGVFQLGIVWGKDCSVSSPPEIRLLTRVYHPNVDPSGKICIHFCTWTITLVISRIVIAVISLFSDPEVDDPLVPEIASTYLRSRAEYEHNAAAYTKKYATLDAALERLSRVSG